MKNRGREFQRIKVVISVMGMAICLLSGCAKANGSIIKMLKPLAEEGLSRMEQISREEEAVHQEPDYFTCVSGTTVERQLSEEEISALFYGEEIPEEVFARMDGVSYVENEDIALRELRYLRLLYVGFDGKTHVGELVVHESLADDMLEIFRTLYDNGYQIEKMRLVDDYGGDDNASIQDNNTSAFNYRVVEGTTTLSRHAFGMAIDINPFYNPYVAHRNGELHIDPDGSELYADREADFPHKIGGEGDLCLKLFLEKGFVWGGNWKNIKDYQHFQIPG